jgi:hypothetical protein
MLLQRGPSPVPSEDSSARDIQGCGSAADCEDAIGDHHGVHLLIGPSTSPPQTVRGDGPGREELDGCSCPGLQRILADRLHKKASHLCFSPT